MLLSASGRLNSRNFKKRFNLGPQNKDSHSCLFSMKWLVLLFRTILCYASLKLLLDRFQ